MTRGIVVFMVAAPLLILAAAVTVGWIPLPAGLPTPGSEGRVRAAAALTGLLGLAYLSAVAYRAVEIARRPGRDADDELGALGFQGRPYMVVGRQYHGLVEGYLFAVRVLPSRYAGLLLDIEVTSAAPALQCAPRHMPMTGRMTRHRLAMHALAPGLRVRAESPAWRVWMDRAANRELLHSLAQGPGWKLNGELHVEADHVRLRGWCRWSRAGWLTGLIGQMRAVAEAVYAPADDV